MTATAAPQFTIAELKARLTPEMIWREFNLPGKPGKSCRSPLADLHARGDLRPSFSVYPARDGSGWRWKDHAADLSGDVIDLIALLKGCPPEEALRHARMIVGSPPPASPGTGGRRKAGGPRPAGAAVEGKKNRPRARPWPPSARDAWKEGVQWLLNRSEEQERIARWRGWDSDTVHALARDGLLAMPLARGARGIGWLVQFPMRGGWVPVGFHVRHAPRRPGAKPWWTFEPGGIPALPFVLGPVSTAKLVIVTEGQWDAVTVADAAGWLAHETAWLEGAALVGIRGASGWRPFVELWERHWPPDANFLLIPDNDPAGAKWRGDFLDALKLRARAVHLLTPARPHKDFNDAHRADPFTPEAVAAILLRLGLIDKSGRVA